MAAAPVLYDLAPAAWVAAAGVVLAAGPLAWIWLRHRASGRAGKLRALTLLTLFLTFDLVLFGAFTRLTDSGLGCPDWPGCYGNASPSGARHEILAAEAKLPDGPVTRGKAWIEMVHRYLATGVGVLITVLALASWVAHRRAREEAHGRPKLARPPRGADDARHRPGGALNREGAGDLSPWWATATLVWVCIQGAFGALTVTMKLYPAIVTAHLLGGIALMVLLAVQVEAYAPAPLALPRALRRGVIAVLALTVLQVALGGWVSTNYAVLACSDFPACQGSWWPAMDFGHGFALRRELGQTGAGDWLPFEALTAIHYMHRLAAYVVLAALAALAWQLHRLREAQPSARRWAAVLAAVALLQLMTGLSNVILDWPLAAAVAHTGGAAALVTLLAVLATRALQGRRAAAP